MLIESELILQTYDFHFFSVLLPPRMTLSEKSSLKDFRWENYGILEVTKEFSLYLRVSSDLDVSCLVN